MQQLLLLLVPGPFGSANALGTRRPASGGSFNSRGAPRRMPASISPA